MCGRFGWNLTCASDGALAILREATLAQRRFNFMLLDSAMPGLDGLSVLTYARADPAIGMPRCAVMVTENQREQLLELATDLELDAVPGKPVTPESLGAAILAMHAGPAHAESNSAPALAGRLEGIHVLLVEDNPVDLAANGRIALDMLAEAQTRYDAVLMDIQMPVMNGYQAAEAIRAMGLKQLPIIAMSANAHQDDRDHAISAGMNGHIAKPIDVECMLAGIDLPGALPRFGGDFNNFVRLLKRFGPSHGATLLQVNAGSGQTRRGACAGALHARRGRQPGRQRAGRACSRARAALRSAAEAAVQQYLASAQAAMIKVLDAAAALQMPDAPQALGAAAQVQQLLNQKENS
jgi:CheY-like chemotaxis protein